MIEYVNENGESLGFHEVKSLRLYVTDNTQNKENDII